MVTMSCDAHQVLITLITFALQVAIKSIKYDDSILVCIEQSKPFQGPSGFSTIPDLHILINVISSNPNIIQSQLWKSPSLKQTTVLWNNFVPSSPTHLTYLLFQSYSLKNPELSALYERNHGLVAVQCSLMNCPMVSLCHYGIFPINMVPLW
jgi:hypothetical protein